MAGFLDELRDPPRVERCLRTDKGGNQCVLERSHRDTGGAAGSCHFAPVPKFAAEILAQHSAQKGKPAAAYPPGTEPHNTGVLRVEIFRGVTLIHPVSLQPYVGSPHSTGVDIRAAEDVTIGSGEFAKVPTGCRVEVKRRLSSFHKEPTNEDIQPDLQMRPRSGFAAKGIFGHVGTIDADYRGELIGLLFNTSPEVFHIKRGERVYQLVCGFHEPPARVIATGEARQGGLGSTGRL